ncbi:PAS domain-containing sensor histidine kinase [Halobellus rubicundus]|uniref:histidine kinase n=1 Tax=Halobellus rubicundus TaxID=2996466 RepID=A0ABD5M8E2_9EURY
MNQQPLQQRSDFRTLIDHIDGVSIWIVGEPGEFEYISAGFEDIWGIPSEEVESDVTRLFETIHPEDREMVRSRVATSADEVSEAFYEARVVRPDGTVRWTQTRHFPIQDDSGDYSVVGITVDITDVKRREEELEVLNRIVRHDIRNDMSVILGWAELLESHLDEEGREHLRRIIRSGEHVVELTEIARDYAEAVVGEGEVDIHPVALEPILDQEVELRRESYPDAEFVVEDLPDVEVTANDMLASVFRNLLNNAVQHNDSDDPVVEVSGETTDEEAIVRVADNGPGIPEDERDLIFQKGKKSIKSSGAGLGLHLVETLIDGYGGDVAVEDNDPRGSVFVVRLPKAE